MFLTLSSCPSTLEYVKHSVLWRQGQGRWHALGLRGCRGWNVGWECKGLVHGSDVSLLAYDEMILRIACSILA